MSTATVCQGWVVIKLMEKTPERILPLAEAEHDIRHYLKTIANEDRLNELLAKWREDYEIVVNENNLKKAHLSRARKPQLG
jgi:uncharacterized protein YeeX (DUF496 family)